MSLRLHQLCLASVAALSAALLPCSTALEATAPPPGAPIADIDLAKAFHAPPGEHFVALQGPQIADPILEGSDQAPGQIRLCLKKDGASSCDTALEAMPPTTPDEDPEHLWDQAHFLNVARVVRPAGVPLLLVQTATLHSVNGNQVIFTQLLGYDRTTDRFAQAYRHATGHNNNEEVRYVAAGPLAGDVISAEPTQNAPFGYWVTVNTLTSGRTYAQILRYRSATHYGDGNPLAVIDSEMPNIEQRLGLWKIGAPLPLPGRACSSPHLVHTELWCG